MNNQTCRLLFAAAAVAVLPTLGLAQQTPYAIQGENFEGYQPNVQLSDLTQWHAWDADPTHSAATTVDFSHWGGQAIDIRGTSSGSAWSDLVYQYNATGGQYRYSAWQYLPSNITGTDVYFILMNQYADNGAKNWSTQVRFDLGNNLVYDNLGGASNRVALVRDAWVPITVDIDLDNNHQVVSYNSQTVFDGAWMRMGGATPTFAAVDLYGSDGSHSYYDDIGFVSVPAPSVLALAGGVFCFYPGRRRRVVATGVVA